MPDCPLCKSDDRVQRVVSIVREGTTRSVEYTDYSGWVTTFGRLGEFDWRGGPVYMVSRHNITTQTDQARRLSLDPPEAPRLDYFGYGYVLNGLLLGFLVGVSSLGWIAGVGVALAMMGAGYLGVQWRNNRKLRPFREKLAHYLPRWQIWMELYYCGRDDVVFVPGSPLSPAPPELFRTYIEAELERRQGAQSPPKGTSMPPKVAHGSVKVVLVRVGSGRSDIRDYLRMDLGVSDAQAGRMLESLPVTIRDGLSEHEARQLAKKYEQSGALVWTQDE